MKIKMKECSLIFVLWVLALNFAKAETHFNLFVYDQNGKVLNMKSIQVKKDVILVDGASLSPVEISLKSQYISHLLKTIKVGQGLNCKEGKYIYQIRNNGQDQVESGCLDQKHYQEILSLFQKMRKDVILK